MNSIEISKLHQASKVQFRHTSSPMLDKVQFDLDLFKEYVEQGLFKELDSIPNNYFGDFANLVLSSITGHQNALHGHEKNLREHDSELRKYKSQLEELTEKVNKLELKA